MPYPENIVWFIRAQSELGPNPADELPGAEVSDGSAVAIRLQPEGQAGQPARTFLLTCAHVIRGKAADGTPSVGPLLRRIHAWKPGTGFNGDQAKEVVVCHAVKHTKSEELSTDERQNPVSDWVVLQFKDEQCALAAEGVSQWVDSELTEGDFYITGYPAGEQAHQQGVVRNVTTGPFKLRDESLGMLVLTGEHARPGVSGGGVFLKGNEQIPQLAGIHRARSVDAMKLIAVSARTILTHIKSDKVPYRISVEKPSPRPQPNPTRTRTPTSWIIGGAIVCLLLIIGLTALMGPDTPIASGFQNHQPGLILNQHLNPGEDDQSKREPKELSDKRRFTEEKRGHLVFEVPDDKEFVLQEYKIRGTEQSKLLTVRETRSLTAREFDKTDDKIYKSNDGIIFPAASAIVLQAPAEGEISYSLKGYLRPKNESVKKIDAIEKKKVDLRFPWEQK